MQEEYRSKMWIVWLVLGIIILAAAIGIPWACAGCTSVSPMDKFTLVYQGGPLDGRQFMSILDPGQGRFWKGNLNNTYKYPSTQRTYIVSALSDVGDRGGGDVIIINVKGANKVTLEMALTFKLVPENLRNFHERLGLKYSAWEDEGWDLYLEEQLRQPLETAFQEEGKQYTNIEACNEIGMTQMGDAVAAVIQSRVDAYMNGHYVQILNLSLTKATPDLSVQAEIERIAAAQQSVLSANYRRDAAKVDAEANEMLRKSLQGEGGMTAVLQKAVEGGRITFWVLPTGTDLVAPTTQPPITP